MTVSVVIPSYNHAKYLPLAVESVLAQTIGDWELVIIDDRSRDDTIEYLSTLKDPRIRWSVNDQNLGTYGTLNKAMESASGRYVAVLNSDDRWRPTKLARQLDILHEHPKAVVCYTRPILIGEDGEPRRVQDHHDDWPVAPLQNLLPYEVVVNRVLASSAVFQRGMVRFDERYRYSGDWIAMLNAAARGPFAFVDEPLTEWRIHTESTHKLMRKTLPEEIAIREAILRRYVAYSELAGSLIECALRLHALYVYVGDLERAKETLRKAGALGENSTVRKRLQYSWLPLGIQRKRLWPGSPWAAFPKGSGEEIPPEPTLV